MQGNKRTKESFVVVLAVIAAIANAAEQTNKKENYYSEMMDYGEHSPLMAVEHLGEGLDLALGSYHRPTVYGHVPTAVGPSRYYAPPLTGELHS